MVEEKCEDALLLRLTVFFLVAWRQLYGSMYRKQGVKRVCTSVEHSKMHNKMNTVQGL